MDIIPASEETELESGFGEERSARAQEERKGRGGVASRGKGLGGGA